MKSLLKRTCECLHRHPGRSQTAHYSKPISGREILCGKKAISHRDGLWLCDECSTLRQDVEEAALRLRFRKPYDTRHLSR